MTDQFLKDCELEKVFITTDNSHAKQSALFLNNSHTAGWC